MSVMCCNTVAMQIRFLAWSLSIFGKRERPNCRQKLKACNDKYCTAPFIFCIITSTCQIVSGSLTSMCGEGPRLQTTNVWAWSAAHTSAKALWV